MIQWLNSWGVICSDSFHMSEAKVWCDKNMDQFQHGGMPDKGLGYKKEDTWLSGDYFLVTGITITMTKLPLRLKVYIIITWILFVSGGRIILDSVLVEPQRTI